MQDQAKTIYQSLEQWQSDFLPMMVTGYQWLQIALSPKVKGYFQAPGGYTKWGLDQHDHRAVIAATPSGSTDCPRRRAGVGGGVHC